MGLRKHGHTTKYSTSPTYKSWHSMTQRCTNPLVPEYKDYGGRGISICAAWGNFSAFLADMGERPPGLTLDRIEANGNYEPANCRWATRSQQQRNRRTNRVVCFDGRSLCLTEWAEIVGITPHALHGRLKRWTVERAIKTPPMVRGRRRAS